MMIGAPHRSYETCGITRCSLWVGVIADRPIRDPDERLYLPVTTVIGADTTAMFLGTIIFPRQVVDKQFPEFANQVCRICLYVL